MKSKTQVTKSAKSVLDETEKRLMAMINGEEPRNEHEAKMKTQVEEILKKGCMIEIPGN